MRSSRYCMRTCGVRNEENRHGDKRVNDKHEKTRFADGKVPEQRIDDYRKTGEERAERGTLRRAVHSCVDVREAIQRQNSERVEEYSYKKKRKDDDPFQWGIPNQP